MSDTPRTDAHNWNEGHYDDPLHSLLDFAKQLERELNAANDRIKRLENIIFRASTSFFEDGSDRVVAVAMLMILDEAKAACWFVLCRVFDQRSRTIGMGVHRAHRTNGWRGAGY